MAHGLFRSDLCAYTRVNSLMRSAVAYADLDNGVPVVLGGLTTVNGVAERQVFATSAASASATDIYITVTPELNYESTKRIQDFYNAEGAVTTLAKLQKGDIFSLSGEQITGTPNKTSAAGLVPKAEGWTAGASTSDDFATLINVETQGNTTWYVYQVN